MKKGFCAIAFLVIMFLFLACSNNVISVASIQSSDNPSFSIKLYTIDPKASDDKVDTIVMVTVNTDPTPEIIADAYRNTFFNPKNTREGIPNLTWNSITKDDHGMVTVDFTDEGRTRVSAGSFLEITTLAGLSKSIILGDPTVNSVAYSVNGDKYISGHFEFDLGIPHTTRKQLEK